MSEEAPPYVSVKLHASLVKEARKAAQVMRRSTSSQIEYWATLGRALESAGLTSADTHALIAAQERPPYTVVSTSGLSPELEALHIHMLALAKSGALTERAQQAIAEEDAAIAAEAAAQSKRAA